MFTAKQDNLFTTNVDKTTSAFIQAGKKESAKILTGNGAEAFNSTGDPFIDQFGNTAAYRELRSFSEIAKDCEILWAINKEKCIKFIFFIRMICRKINGENFTTSIAQKGSEMRHEGIMRLIWLHTKDSDTFWKNAWLIPLVGSWKDIFVMLRYDLVYNGWKNRVLNWGKFAQLIISGLNSSSQTNLVRKYLPQIKSKRKCTTVEAQANCMIAKYLSACMFGLVSEKSFDEKYTIYRNYAKIKVKGTAHIWQQLISQRKFDLIDFDKIHGRALNLLVNSKFLDNHGLKDKYKTWIESSTTKEVKYTGFVYELFKPFGYNGTILPEKHIQDTINKQFITLVNKCKEENNETNLIVVRDTSSSMRSSASGTEVSCNVVAKAMALYFSYFLKGKFKNAWIEFNSKAMLHEWQGNTPCAKWISDCSSYIGNTNFESVIKLFAEIRAQGIPEEEFPSGILCISDGEFDPGSLSSNNIKNAQIILRQAGFSENYIQNFVICLWNLRNGYYGNNKTTFQTFGNVQKVYYMSGYSAQIVSFLNGKIQTTKDLFEEAINQEILTMIEI